MPSRAYLLDLTRDLENLYRIPEIWTIFPSWGPGCCSNFCVFNNNLQHFNGANVASKVEKK